MSMFGNDSEPYQKQQQQQQESNRKNNADAARASSASNAGGSDNSASERGRAKDTKQNDPSTPSDSNSVSEVSNEDPKGGLGKYKSEPDVQSSGDHEGGTQTFSKGELQQALAGLDSSLDPKRAKRLEFCLYHKSTFIIAICLRSTHMEPLPHPHVGMCNLAQ